MKVISVFTALVVVGSDIRNTRSLKNVASFHKDISCWLTVLVNISLKLFMFNGHLRLAKITLKKKTLHPMLEDFVVAFL